MIDLKLLRSLIPLFCALTLSGCLDVQQEIWINPDGSGKLRFDLGLSRAFIELDEGESTGVSDLAASFRELGRELNRDPRLKYSPVMEEYSDDDFDRVALEVVVKDWRDLPAINQMILERKSGEETLESKANQMLLFSIHETEDGNIFFRQPSIGTFSESDNQAAGEGKGTLLERAGRAFLGSFMNEGGVVVTLHSTMISRTNGTWQPDKSSVRWKVSLEDMMEGKVEIDAFTAEIGAAAGSQKSWRLIGVLLTIFLLVAILLWFRSDRHRKHRADTPVT